VSLTVSVIICAYTEERLRDIRDAVASVRQQTRPPEEIVLAVDSNLALGELLEAEFKGQVRVVFNDTARGLSATRNAGIAAAQGDLVAFLDDDAVAEAEWLANLVALFDDSRVLAAGGRAILEWVRGRPFWLADDLDWAVGGSFTGLPLEQAQVRNPHGHNMCFRRDVFQEVGGFSVEVGGIGTTPRGGEEADLCLRALRRWPGMRVIFEPRAVIKHKVPPGKGSFLSIMRRAYNEGFYKSWVQRAADKNGASRPLTTEGSYLRHLLFRAIPSRLVRFWRPAALAQTAAIVLCIAAVGMGYLVGKGQFRGMSCAPWTQARRSG